MDEVDANTVDLSRYAVFQYFESRKMVDGLDCE